jgi:hypothetical protein
MKLAIKVEVRWCERAPRWYGRAYSYYDRDASVYYPVPLNWLVGWCRTAYFAVRKGPRDVWTYKAYERGVQVGRSMEKVYQQSDRLGGR